MDEKSLDSKAPKNYPENFNPPSKEELKNYNNIKTSININHIHINFSVDSTVVEESLNQQINEDTKPKDHPSQLLPNIRNVVNIIILAFAIADLTFNVRNQQNHVYYIFRVISNSFLFCSFVFAIFVLCRSYCSLNFAICGCFCCLDKGKNKKNNNKSNKRKKKNKKNNENNENNENKENKENKENEENEVIEEKPINNSFLSSSTIFIIIDILIYFISFVFQIVSIAVYAKNKKKITHKGVRIVLWTIFTFTVIKLLLDILSILLIIQKTKNNTTD